MSGQKGGTPFIFQLSGLVVNVIVDFPLVIILSVLFPVVAPAARGMDSKQKMCN